MQVGSYLFQSPYPQSVQVGRPDPVQEQKQAAQEEAAKAKETNKQSAQSNDEQAGINVKSSTMYQNDSNSKNTTQAVNAFINIAKDVRRSENVNTYNNS